MIEVSIESVRVSLMSEHRLVILKDVGSDRYLLPVHKCLALVSAVGWAWLAEWLAARISSVPRRPMCVLVLSSAIVLHGLGVVRVAPYHLSYYNPMMGGPKVAPRVLQVGWGEGLDQAARYLNSKPDAPGLRVVSWYKPCFSYFFVGQTLNIDNSADISYEHLQSFLDADYIVIYIHPWQRHIPRKLIDHMATQTPEHSVWINGLEYARVYQLDQGHSDLQ